MLIYVTIKFMMIYLFLKKKKEGEGFSRAALGETRIDS
jgi:hypothetical protein